MTSCSNFLSFLWITWQSNWLGNRFRLCIVFHVKKILLILTQWNVESHSANSSGTDIKFCIIFCFFFYAPLPACNGFLRFISGATPADCTSQHGSRTFLIYVLADHAATSIDVGSNSSPCLMLLTDRQTDRQTNTSSCDVITRDNMLQHAHMQFITTRTHTPALPTPWGVISIWEAHTCSHIVYTHAHAHAPATPTTGTCKMLQYAHTCTLSPHARTR